MSTPSRPRLVRRTALALLGAFALAGAGCGSSDDDSGSKGGGTSAGDGPATVKTLEVSGFGKVLATAANKPVYVLSSDPKDGSKCTGACATKFPPLAADGDPTGASGTKSDLLGSFDRSDGTKQVSYDGQALYTHTGAGLITGAGKKAGGGTFYLVDPDGKPIKQTATGGY